jgi:hypothetical protein
LQIDEMLTVAECMAARDWPGGQGGRKSEMEGVIGYVENTVPYRKPSAIFRRLNYRREFLCTSPQALQCWLRYRHYI